MRLLLNGCSLSPSFSDIQFRQLSFEGTRGNILYCKDCVGWAITASTFRNIGKNGVEFAGTRTSAITVQGCDFRDLGAMVCGWV